MKHLNKRLNNNKFRNLHISILLKSGNPLLMMKSKKNLVLVVFQTLNMIRINKKYNNLKSNKDLIKRIKC